MVLGTSAVMTRTEILATTMVEMMKEVVGALGFVGDVDHVLQRVCRCY